MSDSARVAVVTGASRGIGQAIALELGRQGFDIGLVQRGDAAETCSELERLGRRAHVVRTDLAQPGAASRAVADVAVALGRLDVAVANAGTITRKPALELSIDDWCDVINLNLTSVFATSRAAADCFVRQGSGGCIVHIASVLAFQGGLNVSAYAASKGGVIQLTRALANEWAALGIRVNAIAPGYIASTFTDALREDPARRDEITRRIPAGRWGTNDDVARTAAFLASPAAAYVHGHVLTVDGGWLGR